MALAHVGARLMAGLMSVVVFLTPAHADPMASADASAMPLSVFVPIMVVSCECWGGALVVHQGSRRICKQRAADGPNRTMISGTFLTDSRRWRGSRHRPPKDDQSRNWRLPTRGKRQLLQAHQASQSDALASA